MWRPEVVEFFRELAEARQKIPKQKLHIHEYDETTWAARTWLSFQVQKSPLLCSVRSRSSLAMRSGSRMLPTQPSVELACEL